jgi:hypothetical protein
MNIGKIRVNTELNTTKFDNKMDKLENDLDIAKQKADQAEQKFVDLSNTLENFPKWKVDTDEYRKLADNVDKANVAWQQATNKVDEYSNKIKEVSLQQEKAVFDSKGKSSVNANKLIKKLKRVGLALFSIRSAYTLVSRASSAYLSKDTELAEKLQSVWVGLGSFLAPLLEYLSNMLLKMVGYLNVFVKALTGIDFVARANAKALNKQAKAQKNLNNQMLSFDEINKLEDTKSESGGASASDGLIELPELDDKMVKKLQDLAYWLKENWGLIKAVGIALGIAFGAAKIAQLVGNISTLIGGGGKGIKGLTKSLNEIPTMIKIGIIVGGVAYTINTVKKIKQDTKNLNKQTESLREKMREIYYLKWSKETDTNKTLEEQNRLRQVGLESLGKAYKWYNKISGASESYLGDAKETVEHSKGNLEALKQQYQAQSNNKEKQKEILKGLIDQYNYNLAMIVALKRQGVETGELETINNGYKETIKQTSKELGIGNEKLGKMLDDSAATNKETQAIAANIKDINDVNLEKKELIVDVKANTSSFKISMKQMADSIKSWANGIGGGFSVLWNKLTGGGGGGGRGFATGGIGTGIGLGAIVNNPGKGVSIGGGNIAGERGREGIIPLTDPRAMAELGQQIGRWVSVNLDITNQIDGRVLNRRLEAIKNESNFTTNGGVL